VQERAKDILVVVSGLLFGFGCGALTVATMYLVCSLVASTCASGYGDVYSDDDDDEGQLSDSESPKKAGYVIIHDAEEYAQEWRRSVEEEDDDEWGPCVSDRGGKLQQSIHIRIHLQLGPC
jgi:hypothetical protein